MSPTFRLPRPTPRRLRRPTLHRLPGGASPNRGLMIVLSYLWILALIPFLAEKNDPEVQWHAKNGLLLTGAEFLAWVALSFFSMATAALDLGCTGCLLHGVLGLFFLVVHVIAIIKGVSGQRLVIPGLSQYVDRF